MKKSANGSHSPIYNLPVLLVPLMLSSSCASHHSGHHRSGHHGHYPPVSGHVSIHSGHHGDGGVILGALILGGLIGHVITEASHEQDAAHEAKKTQEKRKKRAEQT